MCNDDTKLTVIYEATFPWCLLKTDLHVATAKSGIPQTSKGNPKPDKFAYGDEHDCVGRASFEIPLDEIDGGVSPGDTAVIAAHAEVEDGERAEGAWGAGTRFVERGNWATYFTYEVQEPFLCGGEASKCVFVTSTEHDGDLGGLAGADGICQALADAPGSLAAPGTYKAWLPDSVASPSTRFAQASVPYKRVDGTTVATDSADLVGCTPGDGCLAAPITVTEAGSSVASSLVWTGTSPGGTHSPPNDCFGWTGNFLRTAGRVGQSGDVDENWTTASGILGRVRRCGLSAVLFSAVIRSRAAAGFTRFVAASFSGLEQTAPPDRPACRDQL